MSVTLRLVHDHDEIDRYEVRELRVLRDLESTTLCLDSWGRHLTDDDLELRVRRARETAVRLPWAPPLLPFQVVTSAQIFEQLVAEYVVRHVRPTVCALREVGLHGLADEMARVCRLLNAVVDAPAR